MTDCRFQSGVGLIEVLIAFSIFSVGVVGVFGSQLSAKKANHWAAQVSIATALAQDMLVRMRSNRSVLQDYVVQNYGRQNSPPAKNCRTGLCSSSDLAASDLHEWSGLLHGDNETVVIEGLNYNTGGLPSPRACIENDAGDIRVTISWLSHSKLAEKSKTKCGGFSSGTQEPRAEVSLVTFIGHR